MNNLDNELSGRLAALRSKGLYRELRRVDSAPGRHITLNGKELINFSSNDYLGLANETMVKANATQMVESYGAGSAASRLVCGSLAPHHELDEAIAAFKGTEAALSFSSGYCAALGTIGALLAKDDVVIVDRLVHACIVDAARLCGAKLRVFRHNDLNDLEAILRWAAERPRNPRQPSKRSNTLIVTESVFSMDGDQAPLRELAELKNKFGAWLMVDEAHATGLYGAHRRGLAEASGASGLIDVQMGTLGKALGASGGYICGSRTLIDYLINRARSFIFSTAPVPAAAAAAIAGIQFVESKAGEERCGRLWQRVSELDVGLGAKRTCCLSAIFPIVIGDESQAMKIASDLLVRGIFIPAIRYPTVARGSARLRLTLSATHSEHDVEEVLRALESFGLSKLSVSKN
jgi:8-amino-7-oxononanoate synthase